MKATYAIYDEDGRITAILSGPTVSKLPPDNAIEVTDDDVTVTSHYVSDGALTPYPDRPSRDHVFDFATGAWELDLSIAKGHKWDEIKAARGAEEFGSFDWGGYTFQCDEVSQRRIQGAVQLAAIDDTMTLDWTLADDSVQNFTAAQYVQIGQALAIHVSQAHERGRILRQQIDAATSAEELEAIVW